MSCQYTGCKRGGEVVIMFDRPVVLCREHFSRFQKVLERKALKSGISRIKDLRLKRRRGKIRLESEL